MDPKSDLDAFLASDTSGAQPKRSARCVTCNNYGHLDEHIRDFMKRKAAGETFLPVHSVAAGKSLLTFLRTKGYSLSGHSLARHVGLCLGIDIKTGNPV